MKSQTSQDVLAQRKVARKYKLLGYDVLENPEAEFLPDFMQGVTPDIIAFSKSDNVVVEVKNHSSLKGSNDLVGIAERVSDHPGWRFELVVLDDEQTAAPANVAANRAKLLETVNVASSAHLSGVAYVYLTNVLVSAARDVAAKYKITLKNEDEKTLLSELSFKGVLPERLTQECLSALIKRNDLVHRFDDANAPSKTDLEDLVQLCEQLGQLI